MPNKPLIRELVREILESNRSPEEVCVDHPELLWEVRKQLKRAQNVEAQLADLFPSSIDQPADGRESPSQLSDDLPEIPGYKLKEVIGHGGMGIVFRARHLKLNRLIALKMLLSGAFASRQERTRFMREAEAVAGLQHPNIVQVFDVGELERRPFFTMELLEGGSLAQRLAGAPQPAVKSAQLLATIAAAVSYAHEHGIVHRDLKPGNILVTADDTPKIADFGLAQRVDALHDLTTSGTRLGTPSYMSPEQANGKTSAVGPSADIYSLGAILYEMLSGRPPFRAETASATLQQVLADEPVRPSRLNPRVPRDLETICLKCLNKEPQQRYPTAAALADDLHRFLRGEPIAARPLGRTARFMRWVRRRPTAAALSATLVIVVLLLLVLVGDALRLSGQRHATAEAALQDLRDADRLVEQSDLIGARAALERAKGRVTASVSSAVLQRVQRADERAAATRGRSSPEPQISGAAADRFALTVPPWSTGTSTDCDQTETTKRHSPRPVSVFLAQTAAGVAERIKASPLRATLLAALDDWSICAANKLRRISILSVARKADTSDPWRDKVREEAGFWDAAKLTELAASAPMDGESVQLLTALGERLFKADPKGAVTFLRRVQQQYPNDFFANFWLGYALLDEHDAAMSVRFYQTALALRPDAAVANWNLAIALKQAGRVGEALPYFERTVQIDPLYPGGQGVLADALMAVGRTDEAIQHYREFLRLEPNILWARNNLGLALEQMGHFDEAIAEYENALRIDAKYQNAQHNLANALSERGDPEEAIKHYRAALASNPRFALAHFELGLRLSEMERMDEAIGHLQQAVELEPAHTAAHQALRSALIREGRLEEACAAWRKELDARPTDHEAWYGYAELCLFLGHENEYRRNRRELLVRFGESRDPTVCEQTARACLLLPGTTEEQEDSTALVDRAVGAMPAEYWAQPYYLFAKGFAHYRRGELDDAIKLMRGGAANTPYLGPSPQLVMALALYQKDQRDQAMDALATAVAPYDWSAAKAGTCEVWISHILRRQAETLMLPEFPAFLQGKHQPRDNAERLALLGICQYRACWGLAARLFADAFAADPMLSHRLTESGLGWLHEGTIQPADADRPSVLHIAARCAALASSGQGSDCANHRLRANREAHASRPVATS